MDAIPINDADKPSVISVPKRPEAKHWAGCTLNNYTTYDEQKFISLVQPLATYYVYGREIGKEQTPHLQFMICFKEKMRLTAIKKIFPTAHLEIKWPKATFKRASDYCKKGMQSKEEWISDRHAGPNFGMHAVFTEFGILPSDEVTKANSNQVYTNALEAGSVRDAMMIIRDSLPRDYCLYGHTIERNITKSMRKPTVIRFSLPDFTLEPLDLSKTVLLVGKSGFGKTNFAKAHFTNPLFVSTMDELADFNDSHDGIVFDDMSFLHMPVEAVIHLVDVDEDRTIRIRYTNARIPHHTKKIFCHNNDNPFYDPNTISEQQQFAIERRINRVITTGDIRKIEK